MRSRLRKLIGWWVFALTTRELDLQRKYPQTYIAWGWHYHDLCEEKGREPLPFKRWFWLQTRA